MNAKAKSILIELAHEMKQSRESVHRMKKLHSKILRNILSIMGTPVHKLGKPLMDLLSEYEHIIFSKEVDELIRLAEEIEKNG